MSVPKQDNRYLLEMDQILKFLPHRQPFLMVDRVLEIHPVGNLENPYLSEDKLGTKVLAQKNISYNEPCFLGHFPGHAIFPGVLIVEALAQAASFSLYPLFEKDSENLARTFECVLLGVDHARFRKPVVPGDVLILATEVTRGHGFMWGFHAEASVNGKKVAEVDLLANLSVKNKGSL
jgi:3-hydroxyacyl-[acyl-carrier-protein] dehydratase